VVHEAAGERDAAAKEDVEEVTFVEEGAAADDSEGTPTRLPPESSHGMCRCWEYKAATCSGMETSLQVEVKEVVLQAACGMFGAPALAFEKAWE
jgi:hypothetical protein